MWLPSFMFYYQHKTGQQSEPVSENQHPDPSLTKCHPQTGDDSDRDRRSRDRVRAQKLHYEEADDAKASKRLSLHITVLV